MRYLLLFMILVLSSFAPPSIYDLEVPTLGGDVLLLSTFKGKKIVIATFNANDPDIRKLQYLDSVQRNNDGIKVVAVPALDFSGAVSTAELQNLKASLNLSYPVTKAVTVKRSAGAAQEPLFRWLTRASENIHFDFEMDGPGKMCVISETGLLYGVIGKDTPEEIISRVLNQEVSE